MRSRGHRLAAPLAALVLWLVGLVLSPVGLALRLVGPLMATVTLALVVPGAGAGERPDVAFEDQELRAILGHGPWPASAPPDPSNRVSGRPAAIALGQRLFLDPRLSATGSLGCVTCHVPARGWTDGRGQAVGLAPVDRNTPSVVNVGLQRWFAWDGGADSLWWQSLKPIVDPREMGASADHVARVVRGDVVLSCLYRRALGEPVPSPPALPAGRTDGRSDALPAGRADGRSDAPRGETGRAPVLGKAGLAGTGREQAGIAEALEEAGSERVLVNVGKALAAFLETLRSGRTPFDEFRDALARGDREVAARYPAPARRGLRLFVGRGNCRLCHVGPAFTNGEFHDVGVPYMVRPGQVDPGRHGGIQRLRADRFNLLGPYSDDPTGASALKTRTVALQHANFGQFKTPSLRNVALTGPYMHDGRLATLRDVVRHYSELPMERLHTHGEQLLRPLALSDAEIDDLVAFLESLTDPGATAPPPPVTVPGCPS